MPLPKSLTTVTPFSKIIAMILFVLLPFAGFYLGYKYREGTMIVTPVIQQTQIPILTPLLTPTLTKTNSYGTTWQTYNNVPYRYSIDLPPNYHAQSCSNLSDTVLIGYNPNIQGVELKTGECSGFDGRGSPLGVAYLKKPFSVNNEIYNVSEEKILVSNVPVTKYISQRKTSFNGPGEDWFIDVVVYHNGTYYDLWVESKDQLDNFNKMLTTFKFTQ